MHPLNLPWGVLVTAPVVIFSTLAQCAPSVNVALKASFSSAPYLIELLYAMLPFPLIHSS
jgi:hypothetical protein